MKEVNILSSRQRVKLVLTFLLTCPRGSHLRTFAHIVPCPQPTVFSFHLSPAEIQWKCHLSLMPSTRSICSLVYVRLANVLWHILYILSCNILKHAHPQLGCKLPEGEQPTSLQIATW